MTVMSDTPAMAANRPLFHPRRAMSSAMRAPSNRTAVDMLDRRYACRAPTVNNIFQPMSTTRTSDPLRSALVARPVFYAAFGRWIAAEREALGWTQSDAARFAQQRNLPISRQQLLNLEAGRTQHPAPDLVAALAHLYDLPYAEIANRLFGEMYGAELPAGKPRSTTARRIVEAPEEIWLLDRWRALKPANRAALRVALTALDEDADVHQPHPPTSHGSGKKAV